MSIRNRVSRRAFLRLGALGASALVASCAPKVVEKVVKETVLVEKAVEKVVEKEVTKLVEVEKVVTKVVEKVVKETVMVAGTPKVVEKVVTQVVEVGAKTAEELVGPELMPGSPDNPKGWRTTLPDLPPGMPVKPPVVITSSRRVDSSTMFAEGDDLENNPWTRMIKAALGIEWKAAWTWIGSDDCNQKYNLSMASGDLPDMLETVPTTLFVKMLEADMLQDITETYETHASYDWYKKPLQYGEGLAWAYVEVNGRKMGLPRVAVAAQDHKVLWIRQDWLDKLGLGAPKTLDELHDLALAFKVADLGQGAPGSTIGLLATKDLVSWYGSLDPVFGAFRVQPNCWTPHDGGLMNDSIRPQTKEALAILRKWYADGAIEPDFFTLPTADSANLVGGNRCGLHMSPSFGASYGGSDSVKNDPEAKWAFVNVPMGPDGRSGCHFTNPYQPDPFCFRKGFEHVDLVIKQVNWLAELQEDPTRRMHGWEGADYAIVDGAYEPLKPFWMKWAYGPIGTCGGGGTDPLRNYNANKWQEEEWSKIPPEKRDAYQVTFFDDPLGLAGLGRAAYALLVENSERDGIRNLFTRTPTPTMVERGTDLAKQQDETFITIINGEKPLEAFDEFVETWKKLGGDKVTEEVNEWWKSR